MPPLTLRTHAAKAVRGASLAVALAATAFAAVAPPAHAAEGAGASLVDEARTKMRKRDLRGALDALDRAIKADPADADANILYQDLGRDTIGSEIMLTTYRHRAADKPDDPLLAFLYARLLPPEDALKEFDAQVKKFPGSAWPRAGRARIHDLLGHPAESAADYDAAVMTAPTEMRFKTYQALGYERAGRWSEAADVWRIVISVAPKDRAAILGLGESLRQCGSAAEGVTVLEVLVKSDANDAEAHYRLALARADDGKTDDALTALDGALAVDRTFVEAYCAAAEFSVRKAFAQAAAEKRAPLEKDFEKALGYAAKAAAIGSDRPDAHFACAATHEAVGESAASHYETAMVEYDAALALLALPTPEKVRALCGKAFVLLRLQKWDQALTSADKALAIDEKCTAAYLHAGLALAAQGRQDDAITKYYRIGLKFAPSDGRLRHAIGVALWETGKQADAKKELDLAVKADGKNLRFRLTYGQLLYELKSYKQAAEQLAPVVDGRPFDVEGWRSYGRVCCALKDWEQGTECYETILKLLAPAAGAGADPAAPGAAAADTQSAIDEDLVKKCHLYLAIIYADHLKKRDQAKEHAKQFIQLGGTEPNLQAFLDDLLSDK